MIRIALLASVGFGALIASAGLAQAQDFDWSGAYIGGSLGAGVIENNTVEFDSDAYTYREGALLALATAGINFQSGQFVYGLEGDLGLVSAGDVESDDIDPAYVSLTMSPVATLRGRFGYAVDSLLIYGTAGLAVAQFEIDDNWTSDYSVSSTNVGLVAGVGVEYAVTDSMSLKAEGRLMSFAVDADDNYTNNVNSAVGLVGVNFHF